MYTIDDSVFALILRFVGRSENVTFFDKEFIKKQLKLLQTHIDQFPPEEQEARAIEWVEKYAHKYRKIWEKEIITQVFSYQRCADCPLSETGTLGHCQIHDQWLKLFQQYTADEIDSKEYVEHAIQLLGKHKEHLKIKLSALEGEKSSNGGSAGS